MKSHKCDRVAVWAKPQRSSQKYTDLLDNLITRLGYVMVVIIFIIMSSLGLLVDLSPSVFMYTVLQ